MKRIKIKELMFDGNENLFTNLLHGTTLSSDELNMYYKFGRSGEKYVSPLIQGFLGNNEYKITSANLEMMSNIINAKYSDKWKRITDIMALEYDAISNYDKKSEITNTQSGGHTIDVTNSEKVITDGQVVIDSETTIDNSVQSNGTTTYGDLSVNSTETGSGTNEEFKNAYDTNTPSLNGKTENEFNNTIGNTTIKGDDGSTESRTSNGTNDVLSTETRDDEVTTTGSNNTTYETTESNTTVERTSGNIGVTTTQQMIESEIKLRQYNFIEQMFDDLDREFTLSCY